MHLCHIYKFNMALIYIPAWTIFTNMGQVYKSGTLQKRCGQDGRGDCNSYNTLVRTACMSLRCVWQDANQPLGHTHYHYTVHTKIFICINLPHIYISASDI